MKTTINGLHLAISKKPTNLNVWILEQYKKGVKISFKDFYTSILMCFV